MTESANTNRTLMLVLSYLGLLGLIPLLMEKEDGEVQWHAKNGLVLFGAFFVLSIALTVLTMVGSNIGMGLGCVGSMGSMVMWIGYLVAIVLGMIKAVGGQRLRLPVLGDFVDKWS